MISCLKVRFSLNCKGAGSLHGRPPSINTSFNILWSSGACCICPSLCPSENLGLLKLGYRKMFHKDLPLLQTAFSCSFTIAIRNVARAQHSWLNDRAHSLLLNRKESSAPYSGKQQLIVQRGQTRSHRSKFCVQYHSLALIDVPITHSSKHWNTAVHLVYRRAVCVLAKKRFEQNFRHHRPAPFCGVVAKTAQIYSATRECTSVENSTIALPPHF